MRKGDIGTRMREMWTDRGRKFIVDDWGGFGRKGEGEDWLRRVEVWREEGGTVNENKGEKMRMRV